MENRRKMENHLPLHWALSGGKGGSAFSCAATSCHAASASSAGAACGGSSSGVGFAGWFIPSCPQLWCSARPSPRQSSPSPRAGARCCVNRPLGPEISSVCPCTKANLHWLVLPMHTHHAKATGREHGVCVGTHRLFVRAQGTTGFQSQQRKEGRERPTPSVLFQILGLVCNCQASRKHIHRTQLLGRWRGQHTKRALKTPLLKARSALAEAVTVQPNNLNKREE